MRTFCLHVTIVIAIVIALGFRATAQDTPPAAEPQYFTLNLPAGVSLISAPLNTGAALARDEFLGLPPQYPLFYGWNAASQEWVSGDLVPAGLAGGYWIYVPTPTTLVVAGQPFPYNIAVTEHVQPGWHLFGVPYEEGVGWADFHFYASGNPIDLNTAVTMGWIDANVTTTLGSEVQYQTPGDPLLPGVAYWVHTLVPLDLRVERQSATAVATTGETPTATTDVSPATAVDVPANPTVTVASATTSGSASCSSSTVSTASYSSPSAMGWLSEIAGFLGRVAEGAVAVAEGHWFLAGGEWAAGAFGLAEYGFGESNNDATTQALSQIDTELDTVIGDVNGISCQLTSVGIQISALPSYITSESFLTGPIANADTWLAGYFNDPAKTTQSHEWAIWAMAGCTYGSVYACPAASNPVTATGYQNFAKLYIQNPGKTNTSTDDFPLWWAYSVLGGQNGVPPYSPNGTADSLQTAIYQQLTGAPLTVSNPLYSYMLWKFSQSGCATDVSAPAPGCDLYSQVYLPVEGYFLRAIGDQAQLAEAVAEAKGVLAEKFPGPDGSSVQAYMAGINQEVNQEAEAFLEVAEQIALYRAADATHDWNNFASSDAGQLLGRADFIVAKLAGQNYQSNPQAGYTNPPWPSLATPGALILGRVFYVYGEPDVAGRMVLCNPCGSGSQSFQLNEDASRQLAPTGAWPYLLWQATSTGATATSNNQWTVRRLTPETPSPGSWIVYSSSPQRTVAQLVAGTYDSNYNSVPAGTAGATAFASFSGLEGSIGKFGLALGQLPWKDVPWTVTGDKQDTVYASQISYLTPPGVGHLDVGYPPIAMCNCWGPVGNVIANGSWSSSASITLPASASNIHVHWPTTIGAGLNAQVVQHFGNGPWNPQYYQYIKFDQSLTDSKGTTTGSVEYPQCNGSAFNQCNITNAAQSLDLGPLTPTTSPYTFKVSFSTEVIPWTNSSVFTQYVSLQNLVQRSAENSGSSQSSVYWVIDAPMITLTQ
jgi:hypothetical protein